MGKPPPEQVKLGEESSFSATTRRMPSSEIMFVCSYVMKTMGGSAEELVQVQSTLEIAVYRRLRKIETHSHPKNKAP
jgi:hypothetical protein